MAERSSYYSVDVPGYLNSSADKHLIMSDEEDGSQSPQEQDAAEEQGNWDFNEKSLRLGATWLPSLTLMCNKRIAKFLGGHEAKSCSLYVDCQCGATHDEDTDGSSVMTMEAWAIEHCLGKDADEMEEEEVDDMCFQQVTVVSGGVIGQSLGEHCRNVAKAKLGAHKLTAGTTLLSYWYDEDISAAKRQARQKGIEFWGELVAPDKGVWYKAFVKSPKIGRYGEIQIQYKIDGVQQYVLLGLCYLHWGNEPPKRGVKPFIFPPPPTKTPPPKRKVPKAKVADGVPGDEGSPPAAQPATAAAAAAANVQSKHPAAAAAATTTAAASNSMPHAPPVATAKPALSAKPVASSKPAAPSKPGAVPSVMGRSMNAVAHPVIPAQSKPVITAKPDVPMKAAEEEADTSDDEMEPLSARLAGMQSRTSQRDDPFSRTASQPESLHQQHQQPKDVAASRLPPALADAVDEPPEHPLAAAAAAAEPAATSVVPPAGPSTSVPAEQQQQQRKRPAADTEDVVTAHGQDAGAADKPKKQKVGSDASPARGDAAAEQEQGAGAADQQPEKQKATKDVVKVWLAGRKRKSINQLLGISAPATSSDELAGGTLPAGQSQRRASLDGAAGGVEAAAPPPPQLRQQQQQQQQQPKQQQQQQQGQKATKPPKPAGAAAAATAAAKPPLAGIQKPASRLGGPSSAVTAARSGKVAGQDRSRGASAGVPTKKPLLQKGPAGSTLFTKKSAPATAAPPAKVGAVGTAAAGAGGTTSAAGGTAPAAAAAAASEAQLPRQHSGSVLTLSAATRLGPAVKKVVLQPHVSSTGGVGSASAAAKSGPRRGAEVEASAFASLQPSVPLTSTPSLPVPPGGRKLSRSLSDQTLSSSGMLMPTTTSSARTAVDRLEALLKVQHPQPGSPQLLLEFGSHISVNGVGENRTGGAVDRRGTGSSGSGGGGGAAAAVLPWLEPADYECLERLVAVFTGLADAFQVGYAYESPLTMMARSRTSEGHLGKVCVSESFARPEARQQQQQQLQQHGGGQPWQVRRLSCDSQPVGDRQHPANGGGSSDCGTGCSGGSSSTAVGAEITLLKPRAGGGGGNGPRDVSPAAAAGESSVMADCLEALPAPSSLTANFVATVYRKGPWEFKLYRVAPRDRCSTVGPPLSAASFGRPSRAFLRASLTQAGPAAAKLDPRTVAQKCVQVASHLLQILSAAGTSEAEAAASGLLEYLN